MTQYAIYLPVDNEFLKVNNEYYFNLEDAYKNLNEYVDRMRSVGQASRLKKAQEEIVAKMYAATIIEVRHN